MAYYLMRKSSAPTHMERLDQLAALLKSDHPLTVKLLAEQLEVSVRTVTRDIGILRDRGYPIEANRGRGGGIALHRHWGVGRVNLEFSEAIDLLISLAVAEKMNSPIFLGKLSSLRNKVSASFSSSMKAKLKLLRTRIFVGYPATSNIMSNFKPVQGKHATLVHQAFLEMRSLRIGYVDQEGHTTRRTIEPQYLYLNYPVWYVLAWDHLRKDIRNFRVDRIRYAHIEEDEFELRDEKSFTREIERVAAPV